MKMVFVTAFFIFSILTVNQVWAVNNDIVINEIGAYEHSGQEWIEIYNRGNDVIDLLNWNFWENNTNHRLSVSTTDSIMSSGEFGAIVQDEIKFKLAYPNFIGSIFDSSWGTLKENGEEIGLKDENGNFVEQFMYIPTPDFSLERKNPFLIDYTATNWFEHNEGNSLGEQNSVYEINNQINSSTIEQTNTTFTTNSTSIDFTSSTSDFVTSTIDQTDNKTNEQINTSTTSTILQTTTSTIPISTTTTSTVDTPTSTPTTTNFSVESIEQLSSWTPEQWSKIRINEFVSNPQTDNEWVELFNLTSSSIDLSGGSICDNRLTGCKTVSGTISAQSWLVIDLKTKSFLNNNGDSVILLNPDDDEVDRVDYSDSFGLTDKGQSLARRQDGVDTNNNNDWAVTTQITKATANVIIVPVVESKGDNSNQQQTTDNTFPTTLEGGTTTSTNNNNQQTISSTILSTGNIVLSEIFPNPVGSDAKGEYIRITNLSSSTINLSGWKLADLAKSVKLSGLIDSGQSIVWSRVSTTIALNNTKVEVVSLTDPNNKLVDKVGYNKANKGMVYRRYNQEWKWEELNPVLAVGGNSKDEQITILDANQAEIEKLVAKLEVQADIKESENYNYINTKINSKSYIALSLIQAREADKGELVVVRGVVSVLPGVFGSQYFYITDGQSGLQIYNYKKEFLDFKTGDLVEVRGEISRANGINRLKTVNKNDIDILSTKNNLEVTSTTIDNLSEYNLGGLVKISGLITEIKSKFMYIDDGINEIQVVFKTGVKINKKNFTEGEEATVIGVLEESRDGWQLWPRSSVDINIMGKSEYLINQEQTLKTNPNSSTAQTSNYLKVTAGGLGSLIIGFLIRARASFIFGGIKKATLVVAKIIGRG